MSFRIHNFLLASAMIYSGAAAAGQDTGVFFTGDFGNTVINGSKLNNYLFGEKPIDDLPVQSYELVSTGNGLPPTIDYGLESAGLNAISADGTKVLFSRSIDNVSQIYIKDLPSGEVHLVSQTLEGAPGNGPSFLGAISPDGTKVAFVTSAKNLSGLGGTKPEETVVVKDLTTGKIIRIIRDGKTGALLNRYADSPRFSPDGNYLAFRATGYIGGLNNVNLQVYVMKFTGSEHDYKTTKLASVDTDGSTAQSVDGFRFLPGSNGIVFDAQNSEDGKWKFSSSPIPAGDTYPNVYVKAFSVADLAPAAAVALPGKLEILSADSTGKGYEKCWSESVAPAPDGNSIAFVSFCGRLVGIPGADDDSQSYIMLKTKAADGSWTNGSIKVVSTDQAGFISEGRFKSPVFNPSGDAISFRVGETTYLKNLTNNKLTTIGFGDGMFSPNGQQFIFTSHNKLVAADTDSKSDVYIANLALASQGGADVIDGGAGNDMIVGGPKGDTMAGGTGNDLIFVQDLADKVVEKPGEGLDTVVVGYGKGSGATGGLDAAAGASTYTLGANVENLTLMGGDALDARGNALKNVIRGNRGANNLDGGAGDDSIHGGLGDDVIRGGRGADRLTGGEGRDRFVVRKASESTKRRPDTIADFSAKRGDRIDLSGIDADEKKSGNQAFSYIGTKAFSKKAGQLRFDKGKRLLQGDTGGDGKADVAIQLKGVRKAPPAKSIVR
jgi:Tol biopolymer transport system component